VSLPVHIDETGLRPVVAGADIKVAQVACEHEHLSMLPEEIVEAHPHLSLADVHAALAYYYDDLDAIRAEWREGERTVAEMKKTFPGTRQLRRIWDKWQKAIKSIEPDLITTANDRATFGRFGELVRENASWIDAHGGGRFLDFVARQYVRATVMGVRRHIKTRDDSHSLSGLLKDMRKHAGSVTREFYEAQLPPREGAPLDSRARTFELLSSDGRAWSESIIEQDLAALAQLASNVARFGDMVVAHVDKKQWTNSLNFGEIFESVDKLDQLFCRYQRVLTGSSSDTLRFGNPINLKRLFRFHL
jgi:uncharacterized protein (DUF433 family)